MELIENKEPDFNKKLKIELTLGEFVMLFSAFGQGLRSGREEFYKIHNISYIEEYGNDADLFTEGEKILLKFVPNYRPLGT